MTKKHLKYILGVSIATMPLLALAATDGTLKTLIASIIDHLNWALVLMMALAIVVFTWYVIKYYIMPNENRSEGNTYVMYSIIGFFVILSFWGLVNILQNSFGLSNQGNTPGSWASFSNIVPGGGSSSGGGSGGASLGGSSITCPSGTDYNATTQTCM